MSEALTPPATGVDTTPAAPGTVAASLYPDGGGQGGSGVAPVAPSGEGTTTAPAGTETVAGTAGNDTVAGTAGTDTATGTDTAAGADTVTGTDTASGTDSLSAASYTLTLPEGFAADDAMMTTAKTTFAELGIAPDKAQPLIDLFAAATKTANEQATAAFQTEQTAWLEQVNAMPEFQGEARATSLQAIGRMLDEYGTPESRVALDAYGIGNNPALVKMFYKMASALSEGTQTSQGRPASMGKDGKPTGFAGKTIGQRLYPDSQQ